MYHFSTPEEELAYKTAMRAASRPYNTVYGTITFTDVEMLPLTVDGSNMPTNSISISKQCIDDDELMFGGVYTNVLNLSILTDMDRYAFFGATVELTFKIQTGTHTEGTTVVADYSEVPLGVFTVADAERPTNMVKLTCYDNMTLLDKELGGAFITGTPWEIFQIVSAQTGMQLDFEESDLENFANYTYQADASSERGLNTYRDVVKMECQLLGCFAYAERNGKLALKEFSVRPDISLTMSDWYSLVPADYTCKYIGISISSLAGTYSAATSGVLDSGLTMIIEDAPAWDYGSEEAQQAKTDNLFNVLQTIDEYTPCDVDMPSDPAFDCGDRLQLITRNGTIETLITSIDWKFHQGMSIDSEGLNPYLVGGSVLANETNRLLAQAVERSKLQFVSFTNAGTKIIDDEESVMIGDCVINPSSKTDALFVATILVDIEVDDEEETEQVEVPIDITDQQGQPAVITDLQGNPLTLSASATNTYYRDGKVDVGVFYKMGLQRLPSDENPYLAVDRLASGKHIITVAYPLTALEPNERHNFQVYITANGGTVTVPARTLQASIVGQEITDITGFSGLIRIEDISLTPEALGNMGVISLYDDGSVTINSVPFISVSDDVLLYNISSVATLDFAEGTGSAQPQIYMRSGFDLLTELDEYFADENGVRFITEGARGDE